MSFEKIRRLMGTVFLALVAAGAAIFHPLPAMAQGELARKAKTKVAPAYPELAKRMNVSGKVKIEVVITPDGRVKSTRVIGGHPLLVQACQDAVKEWKFAAAPEESTQIVEFEFSASGN